ncbi:hypothetical protein BC828DRAFT_398145 [Blastocladiella britannica]|nr:hypothetical protein BC828DRAFT_398145 [Blastocladiella britannica]
MRSNLVLFALISLLIALVGCAVVPAASSDLVIPSPTSAIVAKFESDTPTPILQDSPPRTTTSTSTTAKSKPTVTPAPTATATARGTPSKTQPTETPTPTVDIEAQQQAFLANPVLYVEVMAGLIVITLIWNLYNAGRLDKYLPPFAKKFVTKGANTAAQVSEAANK